MIGCLYTVYYKLESDTSPAPMIYSIIVQSDSMREAVRLCREVSSLEIVIICVKEITGYYPSEGQDS